MAIRERQCNACQTRYSLLKWGGKEYTVEADDDRSGCPSCGSEDAAVVFGSPQGVELGGDGSTGKFYPRWDKGLMCHVESAKHRRKIMKERGLVPVDGDIDIEGDAQRQASADEAAMKRYRDLNDRYENDPQFRDYREARAKGLYPDNRRRS